MEGALLAMFHVLRNREGVTTEFEPSKVSA
jgi:hypothetical protein